MQTLRFIVCVCFLGYAFLLFQEESSVQALIEACMEEDGKLYLCVSSPTIKDKPVSAAAPAGAEQTLCFTSMGVISQSNERVDLILSLILTPGANSTLEPERQ